MSRCINQKKVNHQQITRRNRRIAKQAHRQKAVLDQPAAVEQVLAGETNVIATAHQRQAKNSNPTANIRLSAKKVKKIIKRARIVKNHNKMAEIAMMETQ